MGLRVRDDAGGLIGTYKEITYAHCKGIFGSEFKHGPLSAGHKDYPVAFVTAPDDVEVMINHVNEVTCREGLAIAIAEEDPRLRKNVHRRPNHAKESA